MAVNFYIAIAMIVILGLCLLALIFQNWLNMPPEVVGFLEDSFVLPVLAALLAAWRNWQPETDAIKTINVITETKGNAVDKTGTE